MKSKITSFIISILITGILIFIGLIMYDEITETSITSDVQDFISNLTISSEEDVEQDTQESEILEIESNINYKNIKIDKYFYSQLDKYSKTIYDALEANKENMKTGTYKINLGTEFSSLLSQDNGEELLGNYYQSAIESYTYDNPEIFYIEFSKLYLNIETTTIGSKKTYKVFIDSGNETDYLAEGFSSKEKIDTAIQEIEKIKSYFVQNKKENTYENIKIVHDYLVESIEYDQTISKPNIYNLYGAIVNKECVCEGYAKSFKYLMDNLGINCVLIAGEADNSEGNLESHAWNYVQLEGKWYAIDCTWDDPILEGIDFLNNSFKYRYFLKGENEFNKSHIPNGQFTEGGKIFTYPQLSNQNY